MNILEHLADKKALYILYNLLESKKSLKESWCWTEACDIANTVRLWPASMFYSLPQG